MEEKEMTLQDIHEKLVGDYFNEVGKIMSEFSGFEISFPVEGFDEEGRLVFGGHVSSSVSIPEIIENLSFEMMDRIREILVDVINRNEDVDYNALHTITRDFSLSFVFTDYLKMDSVDRNDFIYFINELRDVGAKTYESHPVDIGVIYCPDDQSFDNLHALDIDILTLTSPKKIRQFFLEEKPLLRLIDNKSLGVVVNKSLEVQALIRKKSDGKSLDQVLESRFNNWMMSDIKNTLINYYKKLIKETMKPLVGDFFIETFINKLSEVGSDIQLNEKDNYVYFSVRNRGVNIFTNQKFEISFENGVWKLKQFHIMMATFMALIIPRSLRLLLDMDDAFGEVLDRLTRSILSLFNVIKRLSESGSSAIFVIILKTDYVSPLLSSDAEKILKENMFISNNAGRDFLNVIREGEYNLDILKSGKYLLETISAIDGAVILDANLNIVSFGELINVPEGIVYQDTFGTGTKAARYASRLGIAVKISEDGDINLFTNEKLLVKI